MNITSRFDLNIPYYLIVAVSISFLLSLALLQIFAGALCLLWLFEKWSEKKSSFDVYSKLFFAYVIIRLMAAIFSEYPEVSWQILYKEILFYLSFFALSFYLKIFEIEKLKSAIVYFAYTSAAIALIGIVRFNFNIVERAESFSSGYATFSSYLLTGLGCSLLLGQDDQNEKTFNWIKLLVVSIILIGITTSLGRANTVIAAVLLAAAFIFKKIKLSQLLLIVLITASLSFFSFQNNSKQINQRIDAPTQLSDRDIIYKGAGELLFTHPLLGYGPKTFSEIFPNKNDFADKGIGSWHNDLLEIYFESGLVGLSAYLILILSVFYYQIKYLVRQENNTQSNTIIWAVLFATAGLFLSSLAAGFINSPVLSLVFAYLVGTQSAVMRFK